MNNIISIKNLNLHYGDFHALKDVNMEIAKNKICLLYTSDAADD